MADQLEFLLQAKAPVREKKSAKKKVSPRLQEHSAGDRLAGHFIEGFSGLSPKKWICVGAGFIREEVKDVLLSHELTLSGNSVTSIADVCASVLGNDFDSSRMLSIFARQELLRTLFAQSKIQELLPELKKRKRRKNFFRKIDRAIQSLRMTYAHPDEREVHLQRLNEKTGERPLRYEMTILSESYQAWLHSASCWDLPKLIEDASSKLSEVNNNKLPEEILFLSSEKIQPRLRLFLDSLPVKLTILTSEDLLRKKLTENQTVWERWHSLDDAAESLAERVNCKGDALLMPDSAEFRRSLVLALDRVGIPFADPRNPGLLREAEVIKAAVLPLLVVASDYDRDTVLAWSRKFCLDEPTWSSWASKSADRGIRKGLKTYGGGSLAPLFERLQFLEKQFGSKLSLEQVAIRHLKYLSNKNELFKDHQWLYSLIEKNWIDMREERNLLELPARKMPVLAWVNRLMDRLDQATPPPEKLRPRQGLKVYRLGQSTVNFSPKRLWVFGLPSSWLKGEGLGDYTYSEHEREILSEFGVRSAFDQKEERFKQLQSWFSVSKEIVFLDASYDWQGRERESLTPVMNLLFTDNAPKVKEFGCAERWKESYLSQVTPPNTKVKLRALRDFGPVEVQATALDHYSRCGFMALGASRWKLRDLRDPSLELWADVKGILLHKAVELLIVSFSAGHKLSLSASEAIEQAWLEKKPKGLTGGQRIENLIKRKLEKVLESFLFDEKIYRERSGAKVHDLESIKLELKLKGGVIRGRPDRIDETEDGSGYFVIDYKTTSALPSGFDMVENGYRLQLPFYALALDQIARMKTKETLGAQFIELTRNGVRSKGIFFTQSNGKESGKLTRVRANSKSLFAAEPNEVWKKAQFQIENHFESLVSGLHTANPKQETDCRLCSYSDLCGKRRL